MSTYRIEQLEACHREMFGDLVLTCQTPAPGGPMTMTRSVRYPVEYRRTASMDSVVKKTSIIENERRRASALVDELLVDIYYNVHNTSTDYNSATSAKSHKNSWVEVVNLREKGTPELRCILSCLREHVERMGSVLVRRLKRRDALRRQQETYCDVITRRLAKCDPDGPPPDMRFSIHPAPGESGFSQWAAAMKMVAQLPGGIPSEFRRRLWLTLAEKHLAQRGVDWPKVERECFSEWSHPADAELGVQIVKDLHRTGCSLFCGEDGQENQALLKRVLLAYARWNKAVGYCQGFNMLAALILQVTEKCESDALKLMIYLIEGVLPDSYFADSLRGLSVDMAVFRELLRSKLPRLSRHLDTLQNAAKDGNRSYEPPLTNVFTMQWFLTLFCNCLPQPTVLRVWDLILLEGNEILLRTALAIWQVLADRILSVRSADEFYCIMGVLTRELLEFGLIDGNSLIKAVIAIGPLTELKSLREHYLYNINPWGPTLPQSVVEKQLKLYSRQSIALDISALKKQYVKLKQRQRQAHIIFSAAISRQSPPSAPVTMNHLLLGKSALVPAKRLGPPKGTIPPARHIPSTLLWKDTPKQSSSSSSSDTELCDDDEEPSDEENKSQIDNNLPLDSDTNLMITDNTSSAKHSASEVEEILEKDTKPLETEEVNNLPNQCLLTENHEIDETSDTFDTTSYTVKVAPELDDENFDFEQFLADRVKCLKQDEEAEERINFARKNSAKALQIIQENSLILHRILQCQSRLSPSPPPIQTDLEDTSDGSFSLKEPPEQFEMPSLPESSSEIDTPSFPDTLTQILFNVTADELKSPEYGSKYKSILEKSKSLDEKYNALILNIPPLKQSVSEQRSITKIFEEKKQSEEVKPHEDYNTITPFQCDLTNFKGDLTQSVEEESNNLCEVVNPESTYKSFNPSSPRKYDLSSDFENISLYCGPKSSSAQFPTDMLSHSYITDNKKEDTTTDSTSFESFPWKETLDDAIPTLNFADFKSSGIDTDSGVDSIRDTVLESNLSPVKTPEFSRNLEEFKLSDENRKTMYSSSSIEEKNSKSDSYYKDLISKLYYNYPKSPEDNTEEQCLDTNSKEMSSPLDILASQNDFVDPSGYSTTIDIKSTDDSNKKALSLSPSSQWESSTSRSPMKSPSKVFNPFPVPLSSRQSKEVPLKLGLYKK